MSERSDGQSPQHPVSKKTAQVWRHQNRQWIPNGVARVGDRSGRVSSVGAPGVGTQAEIYPLENAGPRRGRARAGGPR